MKVSLNQNTPHPRHTTCNATSSRTKLMPRQAIIMVKGLFGEVASFQFSFQMKISKENLFG